MIGMEQCNDVGNKICSKRMNDIGPHNDEWNKWRFSKKNEGGKGTEFAEYFRRSTCTRQMLGNICRLHVFFIRKSVQKIEAEAKE